MTTGESEKLLRASSIFAQAVDLFEGDAESASKWLNSPNKALGNQTPLAYCRSERGAREVKSLLGRLDHGVFS